ncbi:unnamed protein product [Adineta ricciae]|uniref:Uncharacterized protein n=1 Tax=Adineta ricciae TaxID=249248 RepID=A0A813VI32_ADIRI|nr:unnamed protein product [Adineta ricciae]
MSIATDQPMATTMANTSAPVPNSIPPNHTLYVNNLNAKIKKQQLRKSLYNLFVSYGRIHAVVAMKGVKMRGQAFIVFDDIQNATSALRSLQSLMFYGKPMRLSYAKRDSDAIRNSKEQIAEKTAALAAMSQPEPKPRKEKPRIPPPPSQPPPDRTVHEQHIAMMNSEEVNRAANAVAMAEAELQELPLRDRTRRIQSIIAAQTTMIGTAVPMMTEVQSNSTLFVTNLPPETTKDALEMLFRQFSGYLDVRLVPGREGIAFIDFDNDAGAASARDALNGFKISATNAISIVHFFLSIAYPMNTLESQNNRQSEELAAKVSRLKHIAFDIENETKEHNRFLENMRFDMSTARSFLGGSTRHLSNVMSSGRGDRRAMCYIAGAIILAFLFLYYVVSSFRTK